MSVEVKRVKPEIRNTLIQYQIKCYDVLHDYFMPKVSGSQPTTQKALPNCLSIEQQDEIKKFHRELVQSVPKEQQAKLAITLWSSIKSKFGVSYKKVPREHYAEVLSLMARVAVERQVLNGEVLDKQPAVLSRKHFELLVKIFNYARCYQQFQHTMCQHPKSEAAKQLLNDLIYVTKPNNSGFLFVFRPDIEQDIMDTGEFLRTQSQLIA